LQTEEILVTIHTLQVAHLTQRGVAMETYNASQSSSKHETREISLKSHGRQLTIIW